MRRVLRASYDDVLAGLPEALKSEGFGILTEIDVRQTLKQKLGVEFRRYKILGACNPTLAHQALQTQLEIGVMLPCNVVVYEGDDDTTVVTAIDPTLTIGDRHQNLGALAETVRDKLGRALANLAERVPTSPAART
ncbi:MAG: DUF302 domain-containing protein [Kofleriaceae bacterium]